MTRRRKQNIKLALVCAILGAIAVSYTHLTLPTIA